jgi:hypothetical protein
MAYEVQDGDQWFRDLTAGEALAKLRELIADGADPYLYDEYGDPMGLVELEQVVSDE